MKRSKPTRAAGQLDTTSHDFYIDANRGKGGRKGRGRKKR